MRLSTEFIDDSGDRNYDAIVALLRGGCEVTLELDEGERLPDKGWFRRQVEEAYGKKVKVTRPIPGVYLIRNKP